MSTKPPLLQVGTPVLATKNIGPVEDGQPGMITGVIEVKHFFWKRPLYLCTFFGNVKVAMKPNEVSDYNHGRSLAELERGIDSTLSLAEQMAQIRPLR